MPDKPRIECRSEAEVYFSIGLCCAIQLYLELLIEKLIFVIDMIFINATCKQIFDVAVKAS